MKNLTEIHDIEELIDFTAELLDLDPETQTKLTLASRASREVVIHPATFRRLVVLASKAVQ